jgi:hypothetical protein|nr:MAG TPA: hypothetical protein [Caudoviricetes sp.]
MFQLRFDSIEEASEYALSDKVVSLPLSTQALFLHIVLNGMFDEEKVLNIKALARAIGASEGDIRLLTDEKFYKEVKGVAGENK